MGDRVDRQDPPAGHAYRQATSIVLGLNSQTLRPQAARALRTTRLGIAHRARARVAALARRRIWLPVDATTVDRVAGGLHARAAAVAGERIAYADSLRASFVHAADVGVGAVTVGCAAIAFAKASSGVSVCASVLRRGANSGASLSAFGK